jgi:hypothetical protein
MMLEAYWYLETLLPSSPEGDKHKKKEYALSVFARTLYISLATLILLTST